MTRPSLGRLLWVDNSAWPHHMGRSRAATCPEKVIDPKASTVSPDPHGRVPDPWIYSPDLQDWSRTSMCASRTPRMGYGRPPPPPYGVRAAHNGVPRFQDRTYSCIDQDPGGGPVPTRVQTWSRYHVHSSSPLRRRPDATTWRTARGISQRAEPSMTRSGLRAPSHSLRIRRAPVHSTDRRRAQSTICGSCHYSHVTDYQCGMDYGLHDSRWLLVRY
jgi:hypothetical protein